MNVKQRELLRAAQNYLNKVFVEKNKPNPTAEGQAFLDYVDKFGQEEKPVPVPVPVAVPESEAVTLGGSYAQALVEMLDPDEVVKFYGKSGQLFVNEPQNLRLMELRINRREIKVEFITPSPLLLSKYIEGIMAKLSKDYNIRFDIKYEWDDNAHDAWNFFSSMITDRKLLLPDYIRKSQWKSDVDRYFTEIADSRIHSDVTKSKLEHLLDLHTLMPDTFTSFVIERRYHDESLMKVAGNFKENELYHIVTFSNARQDLQFMISLKEGQVVISDVVLINGWPDKKYDTIDNAITIVPMICVIWRLFFVNHINLTPESIDEVRLVNAGLDTSTYVKNIFNILFKQP